MIISDYIDVLTTANTKFGCIVLHKAIEFEYEDKRYILQMTFDGIELTTPEQMLKDHIVLYRNTYRLKDTIDTNDVLRDPRYQRFNLAYNNCEVFANTFISEHTNIHRPKVSWQTIFWTLLITILFVTYIIRH